MIAIGAGIDLTVRWCAGRGNRYLRIRYRYPDHSVHGITIRSRKRHRQASNACICKLFCDDLRRLKLHEQKESSERAFCEWKFRIVIRKLESET